MGAIPILILELNSPWLKPVMIVLFLAFLILFWWDRRAIGWVKARVTYPEPGTCGRPAILWRGRTIR